MFNIYIYVNIVISIYTYKYRYIIFMRCKYLYIPYVLCKYNSIVNINSKNNKFIDYKRYIYICVCLNAYISLSCYRCTELWPTRWGIRPQPFELSCAVGRMWQHGSVTCWQCACRVVAQFMNGMATENPYNKTRVMMDEGHNVAQAAVAMNNHFRCVSNDTGSFF